MVYQKRFTKMQIFQNCLSSMRRYMLEAIKSSLGLYPVDVPGISQYTTISSIFFIFMCSITEAAVRILKLYYIKNKLENLKKGSNFGLGDLKNILNVFLDAFNIPDTFTEPTLKYLVIYTLTVIFMNIATCFLFSLVGSFCTVEPFDSRFFGVYATSITHIPIITTIFLLSMYIKCDSNSFIHSITRIISIFMTTYYIGLTYKKYYKYDSERNMIIHSVTITVFSLILVYLRTTEFFERQFDSNFYVIF